MIFHNHVILIDHDFEYSTLTFGVTIQVLSKRRRGECRVPNHMFENRYFRTVGT